MELRLKLLEPTGGHYSYLVQQVLLNEGYDLFQIENKAVGEFRKSLGISEKSDSMDAKVMSYMGWHKQLHPHMQGVTLIRPQTVLQSLFRTVMRDRWHLNVQLTRRKNQVQQLLKVTPPDSNKAFKKLSSISVMKLILEYPTGLHMDIESLGVSAENTQSGTSVKGTKQTNSGVQDARRVLYQISLIIS